MEGVSKDELYQAVCTQVWETGWQGRGGRGESANNKCCALSVWYYYVVVQCMQYVTKQTAEPPTVSAAL
jgi:hypothetical protein